MEPDHMPMRERPPSYAQSHHPHLRLPPPPPPPPPPSAANTESAAVRHERERERERTLPPIALPRPEPLHRPVEVTPWPSSNPLTAYYRPTPSLGSPTAMSTAVMDSPKMMDTDGTGSEGRGRRAASVLSMEDPDVRLAAEALGDLRADFVSSPPQQHSALPDSSPARFPPGAARSQQPEPLLSLLTTSHPLIGTAIGGSLNAYSASKNYSPRFKSGVEYFEKRFSPVVNTVGSVGRVTGVEGGVRWFLGGRKPGHHKPSATGDGDRQANKRRKVGDEMDVDNVARDPYPVHRPEFQLYHRERRASQVSTVESLPAYDEHRSPSYEAHIDQALVKTHPRPDSPTSPGSSWQSRLVLSTSGLSVAMSEESLRSLKYCLSWLRWANEHIGKVVEALKSVLDQFERASASTGTLTNGERGEGPSEGQLIVRSEADRTATTAKIAELKSDVLKTLKDVVDVVSKYAGGALPDNARTLVRRHLTSLPQRFRLASNSTARNGQAAGNGDGEVTEGARRVMVLAKEGLDMMAQVSGVLDGTIVSAEEWCEKLGRRKRSDAEHEDNGMPKGPVTHPDEAPPAMEQDGAVDVR